MMSDLPPVLDLTRPWPGVKPRPMTLELSITGQCNLTCRYCFYANEMAVLSDLSTDRWLAFFKEIGDLGVQRVYLSGGEVFTRPDLFELIDGVIAHKMRYSLLTNGTLITEKTIEKFAYGKRRLRLDAIQISIDGSTPAIHNQSRPPDSFERALRGLRLLVKHQFPAAVRVTINHYNIDDLENIARLLLEEIGLSNFSTNEAEPMGAARCKGESTLLSAQERRHVMDVLSQLNEKYHGRISAEAGPLSRAQMFAEIEKALERGETGFSGRGTLCSCNGVFNKMAVLHDGTMVPCNMLPSLTMGVIGINSFKDAWLRHPAINVVRHRQQIPIRTLPSCHACQYSGFCTGGCPAGVMAQTGHLNDIDSLGCYQRYLEEDI